MNLLTIDLENWYPSEYYNPSTINDRPTLRHLQETLQMLKRAHSRATFFVLGELAERQPQMLQEIYSQEHEVAYHSYTHRPLRHTSAGLFKQNLTRFLEICGDTIGAKPIGFRAPLFSLQPQMPWFLHSIEEEGFRYDSSVFAAWTPLYGAPSAPIYPYHPDYSNPTRESSSNLWEIPLLVMNVGPLRLPLAGGFYLRILPSSVIWPALRLAHQRNPSTAIYFHPREVDATLPQVPLTLSKRFLIYFNLKQVRPLLERLLTHYQFQPIRELLKTL